MARSGGAGAPELVVNRSFCNSYTIDEAPFETFYDGSWHRTDYLSIKDGTISAHFLFHGSKSEKFCGNNIRFRSRKANSFDCKYFLRPGTNICVLLDHQSSESSDERPQSSLHDARIISVAKFSHGNQCTCKFFVKFYHHVIVNNMKNTTTLGGGVKEISIDRIAIIQKLRSAALSNGYHFWGFFQNCYFMNRSRLLDHGFGSELSWLTALSILKEMLFEVRAMKNRIVFLVLNELDCSGGDDMINGTLEENKKVMVFVKGQPKIEVLDVVLSWPTLRSVSEADSMCIPMEDISESGMTHGIYGIRHSKRRRLNPDRFMYGFNRRDKRSWNSKHGACPNPPILEDSSQGDPYINSTRSCLGENDTHISLEFKTKKDFSYSYTRRNRSGKSCQHSTIEKEEVLFRSSECRKRYTNSGNSSKTEKRKANLTSAECREVIVSCREKIKAEGKRKSLINLDWVPADSFEDLPKETDFSWPTPVAEVKKETYDDMWKEMEFALATDPFLEEKQEVKEEFCIANMDCSPERMEQECEHEFSLDEEFGVMCCQCKTIITERRHILPSFGLKWYKSERKTRIEDWEIPRHNLQSHYFEESISMRNKLSSKQHCVWNLVPDLKQKLYSHQKKAFKFLWRNFAGSLNPKEMKFYKKNGGCVISHPPGTGKTLLVVTFLASYFKIFPGHRPLVLAPKIALNVWIKEFEKWGVSVPVYVLYSLQTYQKSSKACRNLDKGFCRSDGRSSSKTSHIIDCLQKLQKWHQHPSVLLMSYPSFLSIATYDKRDEDRKFMADVLLKSPGVLVLDEGHNPRSTKSKLRKFLMKVNTNLRILLSGTLFQNNFEEYFNTLCLARPNFIADVFKQLNQGTTTMKYGKKKLNLHEGNDRKEDISRKLFIQEFGTRLEYDTQRERKDGLEKLIKMTEGFVDVYDGGTLGTLPGQEAYTIILNSTGDQKIVLEKLKVLQKSIRSWGIDLLVRVASIHPSLIKNISGVTKYFSEKQLDDVNKHESNYSKGCKTKFVIDLVHKCSINGENVLIFCHNISTITMLVNMFCMIFGWREGEEILAIQGAQESFDRVKTIDKFNDPGHASNVLIASTMACSEGISLTAASRVILMDPEWNHSKTKQAIARAFRPGQMNVVYVYELLASGTMEEEKYNTKERKDWLSKMMVAGKYIDRSFPTANPLSISDHIDDTILQELIEKDRMAFHLVKKSC